MKNKAAFLILYALLAAFGLLGIAVLIFGQKESHASETENRMLAGFPEFSLSSLADGSFAEGLEDYLGDAMFSRDAIVSATDRMVELFSVGSNAEEDAALAVEQDLADADSAQAEEPAATEETASDTDTVAADITNIEPVEADESGSQQIEAASKSADEDISKSDLPVCYFYFTLKNGKKDIVYTFGQDSMANAVKLCNTIKNMLPEDGRVYVGQVPFPSTGSRLTDSSYGATGWYCDIDDVLPTLTEDGVYTISVTSFLQEHIQAGETIYFRTDHHWTPLGASYAADGFISTDGYPVFSYQEYSFYTYHDSIGSSGIHNPNLRPEDIDVLIPLLPTKSYVVHGDGSETDSYLMTNSHSYTAYLGGTHGPWRRFVTGVDANRRVLIISDSYGNAFTTFLFPYYEEIHSVNLGSDYITPANAGYSINEYIKAHDIDDVIIIPSTASGLNSVKLNQTIWVYID